MDIQQIEEEKDCKTCPVKVGQMVYWDDPEDGICSGFLQVLAVPKEWYEDSIIRIGDRYSEAEVTVDELWVSACDLPR